MATHCGKTGKPAHSPEVVIKWVNWSAVNIGLLPTSIISSFMGSTLQSVKRFLEVALQLKPEILNFRMNLSTLHEL